MVAEHVRRPPRLLDVVRDALRTRHLGRRTEEAYVAWIRRYVAFHGKRHPREMGAPEVARFLTSLAVEPKVSASTQNQALAALLFLYRHVLGAPLEGLDAVRARGPVGLPVVLTRDEVRAVIERMQGLPRPRRVRWHVPVWPQRFRDRRRVLRRARAVPMPWLDDDLSFDDVYHHLASLTRPALRHRPLPAARGDVTSVA